MTEALYLEHIRVETSAFISAMKGNMTKPVPSCPGWTVTDLSDHMWGVYSFWGDIAEGRLQDPKEAVEPDHPAPKDLASAIDAASERLVNVFNEAEPFEPIWTWSSNKTISFLPRRMAHEIEVHRWDCESASGKPSGVDPTMAADGITEFIEHFFGSDQAWEGAGAHALLRTPEGEWSLAAGTAPVDPDAVIDGSSSDVFLALWRRVPLESLTIEGDLEDPQRLFAWSDLG
ncbi:MAG: hypothetical protein QOG54_2844 [Actinomycetota bacterium]|nr:hypothetical protein [Actinomycetota bacterium]